MYEIKDICVYLLKVSGKPKSLLNEKKKPKKKFVKKRRMACGLYSTLLYKQCLIFSLLHQNSVISGLLYAYQPK